MIIMIILGVLLCVIPVYMGKNRFLMLRKSGRIMSGRYDQGFSIAIQMLVAVIYTVIYIFLFDIKPLFAAVLFIALTILFCSILESSASITLRKMKQKQADKIKAKVFQYEGEVEFYPNVEVDFGGLDFVDIDVLFCDNDVAN